VGKKPHEALFAEFSELSTKIISDKVPENYATVNQLAKIWGLERNSAARRVRMLIAAGKMREAGVYKIKAGSRSVYPIMHYARVR
jgi:predicted transcriptional regulator